MVKTKQVAKAPDKTPLSGIKRNNLVWAGARTLLSKPQNATQEGERHLILLTARVLSVSPFGVNILGTLPYINKLGLDQKAEKYAPGNKILYQWQKRSQDDNDKAICEAKLVDSKGKELTDWITGECSPSSMKMGTLKGYQNHMAQTRAKNRVILEAFGVRIHEEMMSNIAKLSAKKEITENEVRTIGGAVVASVEEITQSSPQKTIFQRESGVKTANHIERLKAELYKMGAKNEKEAVELLKKKTSFIIKDFNITPTHAQHILYQLLNGQ